MKIRMCYLACDDKSKVKGNLVTSCECDTRAALARESALGLSVSLGERRASKVMSRLLSLSDCSDTESLSLRGKSSTG
jgi:hypothetical protein